MKYEDKICYVDIVAKFLGQQDCFMSSAMD